MGGLLWSLSTCDFKVNPFCVLPPLLRLLLPLHSAVGAVVGQLLFGAVSAVAAAVTNMHRYKYILIENAGDTREFIGLE